MCSECVYASDLQSEDAEVVVFVMMSEEARYRKKIVLENRSCKEIMKAIASPKKKRPRFRHIEPGRPYDPKRIEATGQTMNGVYEWVTAVFMKESLTDDAVAAVTSSVSRSSFVMLDACFSVCVWSS